jgi:hypothetical protein
MGYNHPLTTKALRDNSGFLWELSLNVTSAIDPYQLTKEIKRAGGEVTRIIRYSKDRWRYNVNTKNSELRAIKIADKEVRLKKPLKDYWIDVEGAKTVRISSPNGNNWHPYIVFYDRDLNILTNYTKERKSYNISLKIPKRAAYIKISDIYTLNNLKRGLKISLTR